MRALDSLRDARGSTRASAPPPSAPRRGHAFPLASVVTNASIAALVLGFLGFLSERHFPPFAFFLAWCLVAGVLVVVHFPWWRRATIALTTVVVALVALECIAHFRSGARAITESGTARGPGFFAADEVRGFGAPRKASLYRARREDASGTPIFDVIYSIGANGLRITPPALSDGRETWFFGCSLTFGAGVPDEETLPYLFTERTGRATSNFAFPGYGPHQMLRMVETDYPAAQGVGTPERVIYTLLPLHIDRAAGSSSAGLDGPRYVLEGNVLGYAGPFRGTVASYADRLARASAAYREIVRPLFHQSRAESLALTIEILVRADQVLRQRHRVPLEVLLWDAYPRQTMTERADIDALEQGLVDRGIDVRRVSRVLPSAGLDRYFLPRDQHPTGVANAVVADWLARTR